MNAHLFSVAVLFAVFFRSWLVALRKSQTSCAEARVCGPVSIVLDISIALFSGWGLMFACMFFMWFVEVIVVGIISIPIKPLEAVSWMTTHDRILTVSLGLRVLVSWMTDWRLSASILLSAFSSAMFAYVVITVINWHADDLKLPASKRNTLMQRGIVAIYIYTLFSMFGFLIYQVWIGSATPRSGVDLCA
jgi:uncharacterized membrane protein YvlD (DUF360 family)